MATNSGRPHAAESFGEGTDWTGVSGAFGVPDNLYATATVTPGGVANPLILSSLGLALPPDAVVNGFTVDVEGFRSVGTTKPLVVQFFSGLLAIGTPKNFALGTSEGTVSGGGAADLWGIPAPDRPTVIETAFGVGLSFEADALEPTVTMTVDAVLVTVHYTSASVPTGKASVRVGVSVGL